MLWGAPSLELAATSLAPTTAFHQLCHVLGCRQSARSHSVFGLTTRALAGSSLSSSIMALSESRSSAETNTTYSRPLRVT